MNRGAIQYTDPHEKCEVKMWGSRRKILHGVVMNLHEDGFRARFSSLGKI